MSVFPIYRKYTNSKTFFKIISALEFEEIQFIGSQMHTHRITATQFPEKLRIQDMIECKDGIWKQISEDDYLSQLIKK